MRWIAGAAVLSVLALIAPGARADWLYQRDEDPFTGDRHMAYTETPDATYRFGFVCSNEDVDLIFMTSEALPTGDARDWVLRGIYYLLMIVDDEPRQSVSAQAGLTMDGTALTFRSGDFKVNALAEAVLNAKHRVAIGVMRRKEIFHTVVFDVTGAANAVRQALTACGVAIKPAS